MIAGGRLLFACLFLIAVWTDSTQPARAHATTYPLLVAYVAWSLAVTLLVWNDWWRDAKLAAAAHVVDVAVFMLMLYATEGYTSPYFTFFIFILLAAAIRWGWKETAITSLTLVAIYFSVGVMLGPSPEFDVSRFVVRTGHLLIISAILIWFGANQWISRPRLGHAGGSVEPASGDPFVAALQAGMAAAGARRGTLIWREANGEELGIARAAPGTSSRDSVAAGKPFPELPGNLLFDLARDRVLMRADDSRWRFLAASQVLPDGFRAFAGGDQGLALPITTGAVRGLAIFHDVRALATDHLHFAPRVARDLAARLQEADLFAAVEERSLAKARVAVARDLHDSVVQFLAGLGFRLEALNRSPAAGKLAPDLAELKETVMTEQRHLRAFIRGLRTGKPIPLAELSRDCASLCQLLARQWNVECPFSSTAGDGWIPVRTQLDIHHLIREAVANAARHGGARRVTVALDGGEEWLALAIVDDGSGFAVPAGEDVPPPASLAGRVREARGELEINSAAGDTRVIIRLPVEAA